MALCGTALTTQHADLIKRFTTSVNFLLDADAEADGSQRPLLAHHFSFPVQLRRRLKLKLRGIRLLV